ncbi:class F sortase [Streptomyces globisporus]|uniref:class F sortase n=1 Tax=Streptomyces TaxID=1883 RepID=UPI0005E9AA52|nr:MULTISPECIES: class F sortase [Streptomyces]PPA38904.1 class F sortase [Streptomyces griseus]RAN16311.1 class F sortase [Streptomyces badius]AWL85113.1 class F sortase [Streptomyces globisporus]RAN24171.1 class F sortase [Streptomyces badius]UIZ16520.1 class F sortase [Streptomyces sp. R527F]
MPSPRTPHRFRRTAALLTAVAACVALAGCSSAEPSAATAAGPSASARDEARSGSTAPTRADETERPAPTEVSIPSIGVRSTLMELGLNADGTVEVPPAEKGMTAGWYRGGSVPGAPGPAVLIGHNDTRFGRAVFHDLENIREGAEVLVRDGAGKTLRFTVTGKEAVSKKAFPTEKVYGPTKGSTLRLITCDGEFDAEGHPVDNLIVYGALA